MNERTVRARAGTKAQADVTVVVATYGRPDALRFALESVRRQTLGTWRVLVVGDHCPSAGAVVEALEDPRIRFVNLPSRHGEQSAPNTVGLALAQTQLIALLNHDDLWLPDHLARAVRALRGRSNTLYSAGAAFAHRSAVVPGGEERPVFSERTPQGRSLAAAFSGAPWAFEPASSFVLTRDVVDRVGGWRPGAVLYRTPLVDWLLRVWRAGVDFVDNPIVTTLKFNTQNQPGTQLKYAHGGEDLEALLRIVSAIGTAAARAVVSSDVTNAVRWGLPAPRDPTNPFVNDRKNPEGAALLQDPAASARFLETGEDVFAAIDEAQGRRPGERLAHLLERRTGERLGAPADIRQVIEACRSQLQAS